MTNSTILGSLSVKYPAKNLMHSFDITWQTTMSVRKVYIQGPVSLFWCQLTFYASWKITIQKAVSAPVYYLVFDAFWKVFIQELVSEAWYYLAFLRFLENIYTRNGFEALMQLCRVRKTYLSVHGFKII